MGLGGQKSKKKKAADVLWEWPLKYNFVCTKQPGKVYPLPKKNLIPPSFNFQGVTLVRQKFGLTVMKNLAFAKQPG